jgi:hypothetical protein
MTSASENDGSDRQSFKAGPIPSEISLARFETTLQLSPKCQLKLTFWR